MSVYRTPEEIAACTAKLREIREWLDQVSGGDPVVLHRVRRGIYKHLLYDEKGVPGSRTKLKRALFKKQLGCCHVCKQPLADEGKNAVLDRKVAMLGYTEANVDLKCPPCDNAKQVAKNFT